VAEITNRPAIRIYFSTFFRILIETSSYFLNIKITTRMRTTKKRSLFGWVLFLFLGLSNSLQAVSGAELAYEYLGQNQYKITLNVYRSCTEAALPTVQTIDLRAATCSPAFAASLALTQSYEVSGLSPTQIGNSTCNGGTLLGLEMYVYSDTILLPQTCANWRISWTGCCRNPDFTNLGTTGSGIYVEAGINSNYHYSSPMFQHTVLDYQCANSSSPNLLKGPTGYPNTLHEFIQVLTCPLQGANNCVPLSAGLTASAPFLLEAGTTVDVDNLRKKITYDPKDSTEQLAAVASTIYMINNGDTVGYVQSELPHYIENATPTNCNSVPQIFDPSFFVTTIPSALALYRPTVCGATTAVFNFTVYDSDGDTIRVANAQTNITQVFGPNNVVIFLNTNPPYRADSAQILFQIDFSYLLTSNIGHRFRYDDAIKHFRIALTDGHATRPQHTYFDISPRVIRVEHLSRPRLCPQAGSSHQLGVAMVGDSSQQTTWRQLSGPPVYFSDTTISNPVIITTPSVHGDSVVLETTSSTFPHPATGVLCAVNSRLVLYYDSTNNCTTPYPNLVVGAVRQDSNLNCVPDSSEQRWPLASVLLFEKGLDSFYYAAPGGRDYEAYLDTGTYQVSIASNSALVYQNSCLPSQHITIDTTVNPQRLDWPLDPSVLCPKMEVSINAAPMRSCISRRMSVNYRNAGSKAANNAFIVLTIDSFFTVNSSSVAYTALANNRYRIDLDTVPPGRSGSFDFWITVNCTTLSTNKPYTLNAHVYPDTFCLTSVPNLFIQDSCDTDSAYFKVINYADGHSNPLMYWVIEDQTVVDTGFLQLGQGQRLTISYPMRNFETYQLVVAPQSSNYAASLVVNCTGDSVYNAPLFTPNHQLDYIATIYRGTVNSYDPNIKVAAPEGYGVDRHIAPNIPIDYTIHFQNTGTDTAYKVVILDTLSNNFDIGSLSLQGASHPYTWRFMPYNAFGQHVLEITFDNILLVDSLTNEPASHGFVQYRIAQKANLPNFTRLENSAAIYFDRNAPIITNTAFHTICDNCYPVNITNSSVLLGNNPLSTVSDLRIYPNPVSGQLVVQQATALEGYLELHAYNGQLMRQHTLSQTHTTLDFHDLAAGVYFLSVTRNGQREVFKVVKL
jgi:uncharacterized repeat protein (TIGR01451 family)